MKAMILAAGRGERMRPLTDHCPKPLLVAGGKPLIVWHLERLARAGFREVIINHAHLGGMIETALGDGQQWTLKIHYSTELLGALETAGGIRHALPLLGDKPFLAINGDIFCDWSPAHAMAAGERLTSAPERRAHLVMVTNPDHHPGGDFVLDRASGLLHSEAPGAPTLTFAGIGVYSPALFAELPDDTPAKLGPVLRAAMSRGEVSGERHSGDWTDVGTPERLTALDAHLRALPPD